MALGLDPRFDLTRAYWLIAGIGGGDPADVSLGTAVWVGRVIDGDLAFELDARQIPADWPTGYVPLGRSKPYEQPMSPLRAGVYQTNPDLTAWAFWLTRDTTLRDSDDLKKFRARFAGFPQATSPPFVTRGDQVTGQHVLARLKNGGLGEPVGKVLHRRPSELYGLRHGRFRNAAGADVFA
jgi:purine nucleoside permease